MQKSLILCKLLCYFWNVCIKDEKKRFDVKKRMVYSFFLMLSDIIACLLTVVEKINT